MHFIQAIVLAIIEGITEFLPISSTGHMILASTAMKIQDNEFVKTFEIMIQLGAIMAIVLLYSKALLKNLKIYYKLFVAFLPTAIIGLLAYDFIKEKLFNSTVVSISLILGGIVLILVDKYVEQKESRIQQVEDIPYRSAVFIGLIQCLSMIPGVSRAAATILGGIFNGLDKKQAMEFSFLLAIPTMFAASGLDLIKSELHFGKHEYLLLTIGFVLAFLSAWIAVKLFVKISEKYGFRFFGYYRIVLGLLFLWFVQSL